MLVDVKVVGHHKLGRVARAARYANDKDAGTQLRKAMTRLSKPLQKAVRDDVPKYMPRSGGYAAVVKKALRLRTKTNTSMRSAGITIHAKAVGQKRLRDVRALEGGRLRHPVFGRSDRKWVLQKIRPHFFTGPLNDNADTVRDELIDAMDAVARRIVRTVG